MMVMRTDNSFVSQMQSLEYVDAIRIENVELIEADGDYDLQQKTYEMLIM